MKEYKALLTEDERSESLKLFLSNDTKFNKYLRIYIKTLKFIIRDINRGTEYKNKISTYITLREMLRYIASNLGKGRVEDYLGTVLVGDITLFIVNDYIQISKFRYDCNQQVYIPYNGNTPIVYPNIGKKIREAFPDTWDYFNHNLNEKWFIDISDKTMEHSMIDATTELSNTIDLYHGIHKYLISLDTTSGIGKTCIKPTPIEVSKGISDSGATVSLPKFFITSDRGYDKDFITIDSLTEFERIPYPKVKGGSDSDTGIISPLQKMIWNENAIGKMYPHNIQYSTGYDLIDDIAFGLPRNNYSLDSISAREIPDFKFKFKNGGIGINMSYNTIQHRLDFIESPVVKLMITGNKLGISLRDNEIVSLYLSYILDIDRLLKYYTLVPYLNCNGNIFYIPGYNKERFKQHLDYIKVASDLSNLLNPWYVTSLDYIHHIYPPAGKIKEDWYIDPNPYDVAYPASSIKSTTKTNSSLEHLKSKNKKRKHR